MKKSIPQKYSITLAMLTFLDIFLAILIIVTAGTVIKTDFGKAAIIFGFVMLAITTVLKIVQKW